jgi:hypothetical protein
MERASFSDSQILVLGLVSGVENFRASNCGKTEGMISLRCAGNVRVATGDQRGTMTKDEALRLLRRVCEHLVENGKINEGTAQSAVLFEAANVLGAFPKQEVKREWDQYPRSQD